MKHTETVKQYLKEFLFTATVLLSLFILILILQRFIDTKSLIPMLFVLGVFIISLKTRGFFRGITASLIGVLLVNYAFTCPYYKFDLISHECVSSAVVMLIVSVMTGMLTQTEYNILSILSQHSGKVLTYAFIIKEIWGIQMREASKSFRSTWQTFAKSSTPYPVTINI